MSSSVQKEVSKRILQLWASGGEDDGEGIFSSTYVNHQVPDAGGGESVKDFQGYKDLVSSFHDSFSDASVTIFMQIEEGGLVVSRWEISAIQSGEFAGIPPSDKRTSWTGVQIDRFEDGAVIESWVHWDREACFRNLVLGV